MKDLRITEFFITDELEGIYNAARAEFITNYKGLAGNEKEMFMMFLFADYTHMAYLLHKSEEYMRAYNDFKGICEAIGHTSFLRIWEGVCINIALHNPKLTIGEIVGKCCVYVCKVIEKHFPEAAED